MTTPETEPDRRDGLFRFGQNFNNKNITFRYYRDIMMRLLCVDIVDEALGDGVTLVKPGTNEPVEWFDEWKEESDKHWQEHLNSYYLERRNGQSLAMFIVVGGILKLYSFGQDDYELKYHDLLSSIKSGKAYLKILNSVRTVTLNITERPEAGNSFHKTSGVVDPLQPDKQPQNEIGAEETPDAFVEQVQEILTRRKELVNDGLSITEIAWDVLIAIYMLISHSAYFVAKAGGGLKIVSIPEEKLKHGASTSTIAKDANDFGSVQDTIFEVTHIGGEEGKDMKVRYETVSSAVEWQAILEVYLIQLSILTGVPVSILKGITPGQLEGAQVNESSKFDALEDIQDKYHKHTEFYCRFIADYLGHESEKFEIEYNVRRDQTSILIEKLRTFKELSGRTIKPEKIAEFLDLPLEESDLEEKQDPIELMGGPTNGQPAAPPTPEAEDN